MRSYFTWKRLDRLVDKNWRSHLEILTGESRMQESIVDDNIVLSSPVDHSLPSRGNASRRWFNFPLSFRHRRVFLLDVSFGVDYPLLHWWLWFPNLEMGGFMPSIYLHSLPLKIWTVGHKVIIRDQNVNINSCYFPVSFIWLALPIWQLLSWSIFIRCSGINTSSICPIQPPARPISTISRLQGFMHIASW